MTDRASRAPRRRRRARRPSRRAANQLRTRIAPKPPTKAAAITSLTKCAVITTRLSAMTTAKIHIGTRALGHTAPIAIAAAQAVVACPDGMLA